MRSKMPRRPMYGELEVGETYPDQSTKKKKAKSVDKTKVKTVSFGKKVGGAKSALQTRQERQRKILESLED